MNNLSQFLGGKLSGSPSIILSDPTPNFPGVPPIAYFSPDSYPNSENPILTSEVSPKYQTLTFNTIYTALNKENVRIDYSEVKTINNLSVYMHTDNVGPKLYIGGSASSKLETINGLYFGAKFGGNNTGNLAAVLCSNNSSLTTVNNLTFRFSAAGAGVSLNVRLDFSGNNLNQTSVDNIIFAFLESIQALATYAIANISGGVLLLQGGTNSAPSQSGLDAINQITTNYPTFSVQHN